MALLPIITAPDARLKQKSAPLEAVDDDARRLMDNMLETMYEAPGIGLAAIQVGVPKAIIVMDVSPAGTPRAPRFFINPEIVESSRETVITEEGCLSLPDQYADVARRTAITVRHLDYDGTPRTLEAEGLLATCLQHEMDHLKGILFIDYLSAVRRSIILRRLAKARRLDATG